MTFLEAFAKALKHDAREVCEQWLDQLIELLPVEARNIFPTDSLLDHVPKLLRGIADDLGGEPNENVAVASAVTEKARELGELRFSQEASIHQILREYELLADVLGTYLDEFVRDKFPTAAALEVLHLTHRLHRGIRVLMRTSVDSFSEQYTSRIERQRQQLEGFNRMVSHELRNPINTLQIALSLVQDEELEASKLTHWVNVAGESTERVVGLLASLEAIARIEIDIDGMMTQELELTGIARDAASQLTEMAKNQNVAIRVDPDLPKIESDAHRIEMIFVNLMANAIKYSDSNKEKRWLSVTAGPRKEDGSVVVHFEDNGIGIPESEQENVFERFTRAHAELDEENGVQGSGLGLAIVRECVMALEGRIQLESTKGKGTLITITLPDRRSPRPA